MMLWSVVSHGLYLDNEFLVLNILLGISGIVFMAYHRKGILNVSMPLDYIIITFGISYVVAILVSANTVDAVLHTMRIWSYIVFYFILSRIFKNSGYITYFIKGIVCIGVFVSLFGLLTVNEIVFKFDLSWTDTLSSTFQYHNAFATYLIPLILLSGYIFMESSTKLFRICFLCATYIMSLALAGSQSRGGYLVFAVLIVAYFIGYGIKNKLRFLYWLTSIGLGFILWENYANACLAGLTINAIGWLTVGILVVSSLELLLLPIVEKISKVGSKKTLIIVFLVLIALTSILISQWVSIDSDVIARIKTINLTDRSVEERVVFYKDALKMVGDNLLFGLGGGAWAEAYQSYQSYRYYSSEVHSHFLNILVEVGILGFTLFVALISMLFAMLYKNHKRTKGSHTGGINFVVGLGTIGLLTHSLVDFNFSKGSVSLLFYSFVAIIGAINANSNSERNSEKAELFQKQRNNRARTDSRNKVLQLTLTISSIVLILIPSLIFTSGFFAQKGLETAKQGNYPKALEYYKYAVMLNPIEAKYRSDIASINSTVYSKQKDDQSLLASIDSMEKALNLSPYDANTRTVGIGVMSAVGNFEEAYALAKDAVVLTPFRHEAYTSASQAGINYVQYLINNQNEDSAREIAFEVMSIPDYIINKVENLDPLYKKLWVVEKLEVRPEVLLHAAEAKVMLGDFNGVKEIRELSAIEQLKPEALTWLLAIALVNEESEQADSIMEVLENEGRVNAQFLVRYIFALG